MARRRVLGVILLILPLILLINGTVWGMDVWGVKDPPPVMLAAISDTTAMDANTSIFDAILGRDDPSIADHPDLWLLERPEETKSSVMQTHIGDIRRLYVAGDNEGSRTFDIAEQNGWFKENYLADVVWSGRGINLSFIWSEAPRPVIKTLCEESGFNRNPAMIFI